jgi:antitoxin component of MazEF toxin-antitoxin module
MDMPAQVQVVENRSEVTGTVRRLVLHKTLAGQLLVTLAVETVESVDGYANLFAWAKGVSIDVVVPAADVEALRIASGQKVTWVVKRTTPGSAALVRGSSPAMPVQPVENQAVVAGRIRTITPRADLPGYYIASLEVQSVSPVGNYPNLFSWAKGKSIDVTIPADFVTTNKVTAGQTVTWRVKKTSATAVFLVPSGG